MYIFKCLDLNKTFWKMTVVKVSFAKVGDSLSLLSLYQGGNNLHQHSKIYVFFYYLKMCKYVCELYVFNVLSVVFRWWSFLFRNWITVCCYEYIQFRLEKRLNLVLLLWKSDFFQDCEIKSYLYFGPDNDFLCPQFYVYVNYV